MATSQVIYSGTPLLWAPWGPGTSVLYTVGPLYYGHLGDLVKCSVYSGTPLLMAPWGPGKVFCIERYSHFRGKFVLGKHVWDIAKCPALIPRCLYFMGVL